ncbi:Endonuclease/exonuclease/phosphatase, partial [Obelidium mucronatum]
IATPTTVSFLSFNVRFGNAPDGLNSWHYRRYLHREVYATRLPTVFGLQEALLFQRQQIAASFPWYQSVGVGREPNFGGEATPLFYDARVYMLKFTETYWLSETPNVPGSVTKSWGNHLPRIATMAHLIPNQSVTLTNGNFPTTVVVNVHLDHEAPLARFKSAQLVCRRTLAYMKDQNLNPETTLVVILGDFNNLEFGSPENRTIETEGNLYDALSSHGLQGTFHGFTGVVEPTRIDYIYISKNWKERITKTEIIQDTAGSGSTSGEWWPSDHLPVFVELSLGSSPPQSEKSMTSCLSASYPALARRTRYLLPLFGILITLIVFAAVTCQGI